MAKKKLMLFVVLPVAAVISLGGGFLAATLFRTPPTPDPNEGVAAQTAQQTQPELGLTLPKAVSPEVDERRKTEQNKLTQDLKDLMRDMNAKRQEYEEKIRGLAKEEDRIAAVREAAIEDFKRLDNMRVDIANTFAELKKEKAALEDAKIRVKQDEQENVKVMAAALGKMQAKNAADMIATMSERPMGPDPEQRPGIEEAALYLFLMDAKKLPLVFDALIKNGKAGLAASLGRAIKSIELEGGKAR